MRRVSIHIIPILVAFLLAGCHNDPPVIVTTSDPNKNLKENMINANRTIAQSEQTSINEYVQRRNWPMKQLSNGSRIWEYETGKGPKVDYEDSVHVVYDIESINGKTIYTDVEEHYVAGRRQTLLGLDEAVMQLHRGSKAKIILPSNLAYGIGGDGDRITRSAILVMDVIVQ